MRDAPGDAESLTGDVDAGRDDNRRLDTLGEDRRDGLEVNEDRLASAVSDIHADLTVVDRNLHAEAGRILARRNPLAIDLLDARADELLHEVLEDSAVTRASEPLGAVRGRHVEELVLHVEEEVVERSEVTRLRTRLVLGEDVAALESERHLVGRAVLGLADVDTHRVGRLRDANLEALTIVLDGNRLAARLVHADIAERDLGDIEVRDRDDGSSRHCDLIYLVSAGRPRIRFQSTFLN